MVLALWASTAWGRPLRPSQLESQFQRLDEAGRQGVVRRFGLKLTAMQLRRSYLQTLDHDYRVEIAHEGVRGHIRNQNESGRCWLFAAHRVLESGLVRKGLAKTDLSESFANYHAWRTRAATALSRAARAEKPISLREADGFGEGGEFAWASQLIAAHGMVPDSVMPETHDAKATGVVVTRISELVAQAQGEMLRAPPSERKAIQRRYLAKVDQLLDLTLGKPPARFRFRGQEYTPESYARDVLQFQPREYVVLTHFPLSGMGWNAAYRRPGRFGLKGYTLYNVSMRTIEKAVKKTIDGGEAVWFATHIGSDNPYTMLWADEAQEAYDSVPKGARDILHLGAFDYGSILPGSGRPSKRERLNVGLDWSVHAMSFVGYDDGRSGVKKWKVDNSWGKGGRQWDGHLHMYRDFFETYVDQVVVPRDALPKALLRRLDASKPRPLPFPYPEI